MTGTRNPSRKYFKRNQPYFYKSADNWEEWDTDESYDRTFFIGIDDSNPNDIDVALYMIWGGKPVAVVGSKVLNTVSGVVDTARQLETEIQSILKEVQELSAKVAQSQVDIEQAITEMNALVDRCEGILDGAEAARDLAKDWATKMNGKVEEAGVQVDYSAKYYANEAKNSATAASTSATSASDSATTATEQATAAATSAEQAATSASTAASYASTAHIDASGAANSAQAAQDSATSAANSATNAANSAAVSANSAIWAEGTDAQVQALGGVHSSKVWAEQSTNANISLTNTPYTTNRILEIPQNIKLELNNGTLTLKAGSRVYVPNGFEADGTTPKFDIVTIASDIVYNSVTTTTGTSLFFLYFDLTTIGAFAAPDDATVSYYFSGNTAPTVTLTYALWYDTANNIVKNTHNNGATWSSGNTLPIAVCSYTNGTGVTSIDQVFNGFGYIGSTVFALPGVKVQIPNGRNEDGTYKSIITTTSRVSTWTWDGIIPVYNYIDTNGLVNGVGTAARFDAEKNLWLPGGAICVIARHNHTPRVENFEPYTVDSVVNSNEFYQLKDKAVTTDTDQTISGSKKFTQPSADMSIELVADTNQQTVPATGTRRQIGLYRNSSYTKGDGYTCWIRGHRGSDGITSTSLYTRRFLESDSQEIINYLRVNITSDGTPISYTKTPPAVATNEEIVTAGWFRQSGCTARTVIKTYRNGSNWYRKWSDGWIEQGGVCAAGVTVTVNFLTAFSTVDYNAQITISGTNGGNYANAIVRNTATYMTVYGDGTGGTKQDRLWFACGY